MVAQEYSQLISICDEQLEYAHVIDNINLIKNLNIVDYIKNNFPEEYKYRLPFFFRLFFLAAKEIKETNAHCILDTWKDTLTVKKIALSKDNRDYMYMYLFVMIFIRLYAYDDYKDVFDHLYTDALSLCNPLEVVDD